MSELINTVDIVGDEVLTTSIIDRTITEIVDSNSTIIGAHVFRSCKSLTSVDFPIVTSIEADAFYGCTALTSVDFPAATSIKSDAFYDCTSLSSVNLPIVTTVSSFVFRNCNKLITINVPALTHIDSSAFAMCTRLLHLDFPAVTSISGYVFSNCTSLTTLILRNTDVVCYLQSTNAFTSTPIASGTGYIYVPSALIDSYKAATNWSTYADQFRALEDYTVDGTTTGELDSTKI